jgi:hypothetical protein
VSFGFNTQASSQLSTLKDFTNLPTPSVCEQSMPRLGHPELDVDKWGALENRFFDLLDSGQPLMISAEGKSYVLPPVNAPRWRARWQKIC